MVVSGPLPAQPIQFNRAMIFIDGTNLIYRLEAMKLRLQSFFAMCRQLHGRRQLIRIYFYTTQPHVDRAKLQHGENCFDLIRLVLGQAVPTSDGNFKEKGVDALLVADLVYHAAVRNFDHAILVSTDADFAQALRRVEDFGCRSTLVTVGVPAPPLLKGIADETIELTRERLINSSVATDV
jgi:uncharacterized LabA/DUF88 family protein